jgi:Ca-activated chloride channel family protein
MVEVPAMRRFAFITAALLVGLLAAACKARLPYPSPASPVSEVQVPDEPADPTAVTLVFTYGSEKEDWIKEVTDAFNRKGEKVGTKTIKVKAYPMGSGECVEEILSGKRKTHLASPASGAFFVLGNAESKAEGGKELVGKTRNLVLSPVVIAMWKPMAEALGWPKPVGWSDLKALAEKEQGWAAYQFPQWGRFKFGHTHPEFSNSGLISILAECYAGAGKTNELTVADVAKADQFVKAIERSVVHYGSSTGFFGKKMFANGPAYLSAAVLYENMVIESYNPKYKLDFPVVAIYPKEGTFWSDHPIGIVEREWVTPEHREAAQRYIEFLMAEPQQKLALKSGFRPGLESLALTAPLDAAHGIDPKQPQTELQPPPAEVIQAALKLWKANKKPAQVVVIMDTSGSMRQGGRMVNAKLGAKQLISMLADQDDVSIIAFSDRVNWVEKDLNVAQKREALNKHVDAFFPAGETALYDAIREGYHYLQDHAKPGHATALVVLTDGEDNKSKMKLDELLREVKIDYEKKPIRVFCIAYGEDARVDVLKKIADASEAQSYTGTPQNIKKVFLDIGTFF